MDDKAKVPLVLLPPSPILKQEPQLIKWDEYEENGLDHDSIIESN